MPNFENAVIYKICCCDTNITDIYIGSTTNFRVRKNTHKIKCHNSNCKEYNYHVYRFIREHGGWGNWEMVLVKKCSGVEDYLELHKIERKYKQKLKATLNSQTPATYTELGKSDYNTYYKTVNKDVIKTQNQEYRSKHKEKIKSYLHSYYKENQKSLNEYYKKYRNANKEALQQKYSEQIMCKCGCLITKQHLKRHENTKKHRNSMENK